MRTIEIDHRQFMNYKHKKHLLKILYVKVLKNDDSWHFLFEPNLIIRTNKSKEVTKYLKSKKWKFIVYNYPYPKEKGRWGESKKRKGIQKQLEYLLHFQSLVSLSGSRGEIDFLVNRAHHTFLNMLGHEYYTEAKYYLDQSQFYLLQDYKAGGTPYSWVASKLVKGLNKIL